MPAIRRTEKSGKVKNIVETIGRDRHVLAGLVARLRRESDLSESEKRAPSRALFFLADYNDIISGGDNETN